MKWMNDFGIDIGLTVAGLFGALLMTSRSAAKDVKTSILGILAGVLSANYLTPLVLSFISVNENSKFGIAFLLGFLGLRGVELIADKIKKGVK
jgi:hypothetical protein